MKGLRKYVGTRLGSHRVFCLQARCHVQALYSLHRMSDVWVGKLSPFKVFNCTELLGNVSRTKYGPNHTALNLHEQSNFRASWSKTIIPDLKVRILCLLSKVIFLRLWMASMCWALALRLSSRASREVYLLFSEWLSVRQESTATLNDSTSKMETSTHCNKDGDQKMKTRMDS